MGARIATFSGQKMGHLACGPLANRHKLNWGHEREYEGRKQFAIELCQMCFLEEESE